ncbi:MAG TPA: hypothetical protein VMW16_05430 [Sedimentisphaerales bacterium]|nr:hypothetical protein [Sedimentisphaerales bacterium]
MSGKSFFSIAVVSTLAIFAGGANAFQQAHDPTVPDGAADVGAELVLGWLPGEGAVTHYVLLSTDYDSVKNGSFRACKAIQSGTAYNTGPLLLGATYYWRIDELGSGGYAPGQTWSFTVRDSAVVDDMESYSGNTDYIFDTWLDGAGDVDGIGGNGTGSCVELSMSTVRSGAKAMRYSYENYRDFGWERDANYSEAGCTFDPPQDWVANGEEALVIWFFGDQDNDISPMWVAVSDGTAEAICHYGDSGEDPEDIKKQQWMYWNISLSDLTEAGLDLTSVVSFSIGFGDPAAEKQYGRGIVYFDDIRLHPAGHVPGPGAVADFSGNYVVDVQDIQIFSAEWLDNGSVGADLWADNSVDFRDYAVLAGNWLNNKAGR